MATDGNQEKQYWLLLHRHHKIGPAKFKLLLDHEKKLSHYFNQQTPTATLRSFLTRWQNQDVPFDWKGVERDLAWAQTPGCHIVTWLDESYPEHLKTIDSSPPVLYVKGDLGLLHSFQLGMVGSRHPSSHGQRAAFEMAHDLSEAGLTITSGLALGIDAASHRGALKAKGKTIAVLGQGLQSIYPRSNQKLAQEILESQGAIVSEYPIGTEPIPANFPRRNRIISGLSLGVFVVEATLKSGSLITAHYALNQGRDVFAMPGSIHNPLAKGCHHLIREGAKCVEKVDHILEDLQQYAFQSKSVSKPQSKTNVHQKEKLPSQLQKLLSQIGFESTSLDTIVEQTGLTAQSVSSMLTELELRGAVTLVPGGYIRA